MKKRYYVLITIFLLIAFCVVWNIYDNQRFVVTEQTVTLDDLPNSFDGYHILQISDLHGKYFGENQLDLLSSIRLSISCFSVIFPVHQRYRSPYQAYLKLSNL